MLLNDASQMRSAIGQTIISKWLNVGQGVTDPFAEVTGDRQFIHVTPERTAATAFGGTIVHGCRLLSLLPLLPQLRATADQPLTPRAKVRIDCGFDRVRFVSPARTDSRIRASFTLAEVEEKQPGQFQTTTDVVIEVEGRKAGCRGSVDQSCP